MRHGRRVLRKSFAEEVTSDPGVNIIKRKAMTRSWQRTFYSKELASAMTLGQEETHS